MHAIAVNQPGLSAGQLATLNTNPCDGQGRITDPTINYKEGDTVTFAINICNTGTADLVFGGPGDNDHTIVLTDILGNLVKPTAGWNAQISCGNDCQVRTPDDTTQPGKILLNIEPKAGSIGNRLVAAGGLWTLFFNAVIRAPTGATQPYYYFTNCIADTTTPAMNVNNLPSADDLYHNITGSTFDVPGFCLQALFSRGSSAPDRREIAP